MLVAKLLSVSVCLIVGGVALYLGVHYQGNSQALAHMQCDPTYIGRFDPIVMPGMSGMGHEHVFFGNELVAIFKEKSNKSNLLPSIGMVPTSCGNPRDSAAYWIPTAYQLVGGKPVMVTPKRVIAYYRYTNNKPVQGTNAQPAEAYPFDARIVAGNAKQTSGTQPNIVDYACGVASNYPPTAPYPIKPGPYLLPSDVDCNDGSTSPGLSVHVHFPECWDGTVPGARAVDGSSTTDFTGDPISTRINHYAYQSGNTCPSGFPHRMPALTVEVMFDKTVDTHKMYFSCDNGSNPLADVSQASWGRCLHADFWNLWDPRPDVNGQTGLQQMLATCINIADEGDIHTNPAKEQVCGDAGGNQAVDTARPKVTAPTTTATSPVKGTIAVSASGTSTDSAVSHINFYLVDSTGTTLPLTSQDGLSTINVARSYTAQLDTTIVPDGTYTLAARAFDVGSEGSTLTLGPSVIIRNGTPPPAGNGDANGDGRINAMDLSMVISRDGQNYAAADFNHDSTVGAADLAILLGHWTW